jgi:hypothetical protein
MKRIINLVFLVPLRNNYKRRYMSPTEVLLLCFVASLPIAIGTCTA